MYTISIANQKGGVGKTTTAVNLSACLGKLGYSTLLVDMDPQSQASTCFNIEGDTATGTIYDVLLGDSSAANMLPDLVIPTIENLHLIPSRLLSPDEEGELTSQPGRLRRLKNALKKVDNRYQFCLIDCPPSLGMHTYNSLLASDAVILTVQTSFLALHGVTKILNIIDRVKKDQRHSLEVFALATMFDRRTRFAQDVLADMRNYFQDNLFDTVIRNNVKLREAASFGRPISEYARRSYGHEDYSALAAEVVKKVKK